MKSRSMLLAAVGLASLVGSGCQIPFFTKTSTSHDGTKTDTASIGTGPVVVSIDGKPVSRKDEFLEFATQAVRANPYLANFGITSYETAPAPVQEQLVEAMVQQQLITVWGNTNGIAETALFKEKFEKMQRQLRQALIAQEYEERILAEVTVSDDDISNEFNTSRERFVKTHGSFSVVGVQCKTQDDADNVYRLVAESQLKSLNDAANDVKATVKDFGKISKDPRLAMSSDVPFAVRKAVFSLSDKESFAKAEDGDSFWVLQVTDRQPSVYFTLAEIRPQVEDMVRSNKFRELRESRLKVLRGEHTVDVDTSSLGASGPDPLAAMQQAAAAAKAEEKPATVSA